MSSARVGQASSPITHHPSLQYALIADDLTGALDAGAGFAAAGLRATLPFSGLPEDAPGADVILINTESRELAASEAASATRVAAERLQTAGVPRVYKKIDSVLRGHPGPELAAVLDVYRGRALVAPAFPAQGRITRNGIQYVRGEPAAPYGGFLRDALEAAAARSDIRDAETDANLQQIAREAARNPAYRVWCGTAGLAKHAPDALELSPGKPPLVVPACQRVVVIAGTAHPVTAAQTTVLLNDGWAHVRLNLHRPYSPADLGGLRNEVRQGVATGRLLISTVGGLSEAEINSLQASAEITGEVVIAALQAVASALDLVPGTGLVITGGETAVHVCRVLGARAIHIVSEVQPGIPFGLLELPSGTFPIATKSGGFGGPEALLRAARALHRIAISQ